MENVTYFNAGAGSGKTYTLTQKLVELILNGVKPEQVILTTFTTKAASEFKEKAKAELYKEGLYDSATHLDQAMIGTVHSVCQQFIGKYWFHLGLSPNMNVMAEEDTQYYLSQSLAELPTENELHLLHEYCMKFDVRERQGFFVGDLDYDFWQGQLKKIIEFTTNYEIDDYAFSEKKSLEFVRGLMDESCTVNISDEELEKVLDEAELRIQKNVERYNLLQQIRRGRDKKTIAWYKLVYNTFKAKYGETIRKESSKIWLTSEIYNLQEKYIKLMFKLAKRWKDQFAHFKIEKNLLDYNDMEKYMHQLMQDPEVAAQIKKSYRYLFVDEFQDSSPIQMKIFVALSDLMEHSYWVGDYKQAIYGFRGSDIELVKTVVDRIYSGKDGCDIKTLDTSYRSLPDIVEVNNAVFTKTFANVLDFNSIHLNTHRENSDNVVSLRYFFMKGQKGIAAHVLKLILDGAKPYEIAVLARSNSELDKVADSLKQFNIPVNRANIPLIESVTFQLVMALLKIMSNRNDTLAKATVAFLTENGYSTSRIIEEKLENPSPDIFLSNTPLITGLLTLIPKLQHQSIASMVESLIIELDLYNVVKRMEDPSFGASCLQTVIETACSYEEHSIQMNLPATINGFIDYIYVVNPKSKGNQNGVQLLTYHSAKGLQWKYVILTSLNNHPADEQKIIRNEIFGVHFDRILKHSDESTYYPKIYIRLIPWVYGSEPNINIPDVLKNRVLNSELFKRSSKAALAEANRLMYVGMTRAIDVLLLHIDMDAQKESSKYPLMWFKDIGLENVGCMEPKNKLSSPTLKEWDILGVEKLFSDYTIYQDLESLPIYKGDNNDYTQYMQSIRPDTVKKQFLPKHVSPSEINTYKGTVLYSKRLVERIPFGQQPSDMAIVGNCIHQIFAVIEDLPISDINLKEIIKSYGLENVLTDLNSIKQAWKNLKNWLTKKFGKAVKTYHERPFRMERDGQMIVGCIDFVWETTKGVILIDFKTCPMVEKHILNEDSEHYAGWYAGQLNAYSDALEAAKEKVLKRFIYYPVNGIIAEIGR
ncbi:MAG: UvrD-helicase domain-containing protein [Prevotella sp.]|nr:UvrD-helicase domain-containing protein [Prevotella sp.]